MQTPPSDRDRRNDARVPVEMWVEEDSPNAVYFQRSANLSSGGLYLENSIPQAVGTRMELKFTLPGDESALQVSAVIVKIEQQTALGMHLQFIEMPEDVAQRIVRFVERELIQKDAR